MATVAVSPRGQLSSLRQRLDVGSGILPYAMVIPSLLLVAMIAVYPIIDALRLSLFDNPLLPSGAAFVGLHNYAQVLGDPQFRGSIGSTVIFSVASVTLETILGLGIAMLINQTFPGRGLVRAAILIPWAFPTVISGQIWQLMYNSQTGIVTYILQGLHIMAPGDTLLRTTNGLLIATTLTDVWKTTPFMALLILAGLQVIPKELYEAAGVDGSTRWQQFWTITLPLLKSSLLIALLFRTLDAIRVFDLFYILAGRQVQTVASYSYDKMFNGTTSDFSTGVASAIILFIAGVGISLVFVRLMGGVSRQS